MSKKRAKKKPILLYTLTLLGTALTYCLFPILLIYVYLSQMDTMKVPLEMSPPTVVESNDNTVQKEIDEKSDTELEPSPFELKLLPQNNYITEDFSKIDIVFLHDGNVYVFSEDGSYSAVLIDKPNAIIQVSVSRDGQKLAYTTAEIKLNNENVKYYDETLYNTLTVFNLVSKQETLIAGPSEIKFSGYGKESIEYLDEMNKNTLYVISFNQDGSKIIYSRNGTWIYDLINGTTQKVYEHGGYHDGIWHEKYLLMYYVPYEGLGTHLFMLNSDELIKIETENTDFYSHAGGSAPIGITSEEEIIVLNLDYITNQHWLQTYNISNNSLDTFLVLQGETNTPDFGYRFNGTDLYLLGGMYSYPRQDFYNLNVVSEKDFNRLSVLGKISNRYSINDFEVKKDRTKVLIRGFEQKDQYYEDTTSLIVYDLKEDSVLVLFKYMLSDGISNNDFKQIFWFDSE